MGLKTNENILRLGKTKEWKSKYIEKKSNESSVFAFKDLELQKFIYKFFSQSGLSVNNCKITFSEKFLHIFVSYFTLPTANSSIYQDNSRQKIKISFKKKKSKRCNTKENALKKKISNYFIYNKKHFHENIYKIIGVNKYENVINHYYFIDKRFRRLALVNFYNDYSDIKNYTNIAHLKTNLFIKRLLKILNLFLGKKKAIRLSLEQLNNDSSILKTLSNKKKNLIITNLLKLRKFQKNDFFKVGVTLIYCCVSSDKSSEMLAKYIAYYFKIFKRHKFFLNFLKNTLKIFVNKNFSEIKRIKISIKGRFNGAPRAKKHVIEIGTPPSMTLNSKINYSESTSFTSNGTFGIKVWTYM